MAEIKNPCTHKRVCRDCNKVAVNERPLGCSAIKCEDYKPCPGCGLNKTLHVALNRGELCSNCVSAPVINKEVKSMVSKTEDGKLNLDKANIPGLVHSITLPGVCPDALQEHEKEYYRERWDEYKGYYRNPAAFFNCHQLILMEIHSQYLNDQLMQARGELHQTLSRDLQVMTNLRKLVTDQLPDREAADVMDDEKSLSVIYDNYVKEKKTRSLGPVSRIFRRDTLALAPNLFFPIDPKLLLEQCGFKLIDIERVLPKIKEFAGEKTPEEILEFFGFNLHEEFAIAGAVHDIDDFDPEADLAELYGEGEGVV